MFHIGMKESIFLKSEILNHLKGKNSKYLTVIFRGFPGVSVVKNLPSMWETWVLSLGQEDPLEKGKATHSSILDLPWWLRW